METRNIEMRLPAHIYDKLETMAKKAKLTLEKLSSVLIEAFIEYDGKVFIGKWEEGPGIRLLPDWPRFSSGVMKIEEKEMRERS